MLLLLLVHCRALACDVTVHLVAMTMQVHVIGYSKENLKIHTGVPSLPSLTLPSPSSPPRTFPSLSPSPLFLYPLPSEVGSLKSS